MPSWGPFLAVTVLIVVVLLVLARRSADAIEEFAPDSDLGEDAPDSEEIVPGDHQRMQPPAGPRIGEEGPGPVDDGATATPSRYQAGEQRERPVDTADSDDVEGPSTLDAGGRPQRGEEFEADTGTEQLFTSGMLMANVLVTQGVVAVVLVVAAWYFDIPAEAFGIVADGGSPEAVGVGLVFGGVLWIANELSTTVADAVGAAYDEQVRELMAPDSPRGWVALFGVVLPTIAVAEELLFRGALIGVPEAYGLNVWLLAVVSSVAFALGHGAQGRVGVVVTGALGLVLAGGYVFTGSLVVVVVAHYVINTLEFLVHEFFGVGDVTADWALDGIR